MHCEVHGVIAAMPWTPLPSGEIHIHYLMGRRGQLVQVECTGRVCDS